MWSQPQVCIVTAPGDSVKVTQPRAFNSDQIPQRIFLSEDSSHVTCGSSRFLSQFSSARIALPTQINECLRKKVKVTPNRGPNKDTKVTHYNRFGRKWVFTGFSKWNGKRQNTVFYKSSSLNKYNDEYIAWGKQQSTVLHSNMYSGNARNARLSVPRQTSSAAQNLIHFISSITT